MRRKKEFMYGEITLDEFIEWLETYCTPWLRSYNDSEEGGSFEVRYNVEDKNLAIIELQQITDRRKLKFISKVAQRLYDASEKEKSLLSEIDAPVREECLDKVQNKKSCQMSLGFISKVIQRWNELPEGRRGVLSEFQDPLWKDRPDKFNTVYVVSLIKAALDNTFQ